MEISHTIKQALLVELWMRKYGLLPYLRYGGILVPGERLLVPPSVVKEVGQGDCNVVANHLAQLLIQMGVPEELIRVLLVCVPYRDHERGKDEIQHTVLSVESDGETWLCGATPLDQLLLGGEQPIPRHACRARMRIREQVKPHDFDKRLGAAYPVRHVQFNGHGPEVLCQEKEGTVPLVDCPLVGRCAAPMGQDPGTGAAVELGALALYTGGKRQQIRYDVRCAIDELHGGVLWCRAGMQLSLGCAPNALRKLRRWAEELGPNRLVAAIRARSRLPDGVCATVQWELRPRELLSAEALVGEALLAAVRATEAPGS